VQQNVAALVTALATGMRRGELLALRWRDVDLDGAVLSVEQSLEQTKSGLRIKAPKTRFGRRRITLPASAVTVLRDHWKGQQERRLQLGMGKTSMGTLETVTPKVITTWPSPVFADQLQREFLAVAP
jgi:integrase